tara:strand:- start:834 stop:3044 length:2211 start_codon:yes stop_codon:yes gene_type:complete
MYEYDLHRLGWKAFQDLCIALTEERLKKPVQTFLPSNDAGRDGAFRGTWNENGPGESTIQCKFTSKKESNLTLSMLKDEIPKAKRLADLGLADDYIILTNHLVTGASELKIREAFQKVGVGTCRVFHRDWIIQRIEQSSTLRMMVPRLYGLMDLSSVLDVRAYKQAQLILREMGDNLQKFVVTDAHRRSVRAVSQHSLVLLLGSPAAGKSTIGASLALGATDIWNCLTIKSTSPEHLHANLDPEGGQFFWIDDAWGSTQYQRERTEAWNQVFPLMQGAIKRGSRFLFTSRDYIWRDARKELKLQALPILSKSQVIINVHELTVEERARILYNHLKLGDQNEEFRLTIRPMLPDIATRNDFLPETARRLGARFFTGNLPLTKNALANYFAHPKDFLEQTIESLAPESLAAIAMVFLNGGKVRSPASSDALEKPAFSFGVTPAKLRTQLEALNGSLLNLSEDEEGPYWTYRHPTVSDAFASYLSKSPELIEIYLKGAKPESILREVVCAGIHIYGAPLVVPNSMHELLADRIASLSSYNLVSFISYRSNKHFTQRLMGLRPDIWDRLDRFNRPLKDSSDVDLLVTLHTQGLLAEDRRLKFVEQVRAAAVEEADDSFLEKDEIGAVLTDEEIESILDDVKLEVIDKIDEHVERLAEEWDTDYAPEDYFDTFQSSVKRFSAALECRMDIGEVNQSVKRIIRYAVDEMNERYEPPSSESAPTQQSISKEDSLSDLFRDIAD